MPNLIVAEITDLSDDDHKQSVRFCDSWCSESDRSEVPSSRFNIQGFSNRYGQHLRASLELLKECFIPDDGWDPSIYKDLKIDKVK